MMYFYTEDPLGDALGRKYGYSFYKTEVNKASLFATCRDEQVADLIVNALNAMPTVEATELPNDDGHPLSPEPVSSTETPPHEHECIFDDRNHSGSCVCVCRAIKGINKWTDPT